MHRALTRAYPLRPLAGAMRTQTDQERIRAELDALRPLAGAMRTGGRGDVAAAAPGRLRPLAGAMRTLRKAQQALSRKGCDPSQGR